MSNQPSQPATLHNTVGDTVPVVTDDQGIMRALPPNGRLVVAAGQIIASAWGNTTYDQTFMTFANAADRTNQWPVPNEGGLSFLMDSRTPWIYRQGAWRGLPLGFMNAATGPSGQTDYGPAATTVVSVSWPAAAGRQYRVSGYAYGTQITAVAGSAALRLNPPADVFLAYLNSVPVNTIVSGSAVALYTGVAGTMTVNLQANAANGALRIGANQASLLVEDIGG